jgi:hypothetical protein
MFLEHLGNGSVWQRKFFTSWQTGSKEGEGGKERDRDRDRIQRRERKSSRE